MKVAKKLNNRRFQTTGELQVKNKQWRKSMQDEVDSLVRRGTWELVERKQAKRIMKCVWAFKCKRDEKGIGITRFKSRLNAAGILNKSELIFSLHSLELSDTQRSEYSCH
jgi:hypothetical protein